MHPSSLETFENRLEWAGTGLGGALELRNRALVSSGPWQTCFPHVFMSDWFGLPSTGALSLLPLVSQWSRPVAKN